jgi:hypothetical protein
MWEAIQFIATVKEWKCELGVAIGTSGFMVATILLSNRRKRLATCKQNGINHHYNFQVRHDVQLQW